jgi:hypothetical protein
MKNIYKKNLIKTSMTLETYIYCKTNAIIFKPVNHISLVLII